MCVSRADKSSGCSAVDRARKRFESDKIERMETAAERGVGPGAAFVVGPTGAGKTAFAIALAERLGAEIVNADSRQVYRGMDIGAAKPSAAERARAPHHLFDLRDPIEPLDAAEFARIARRTVAEIAARGRPALVVGGSGLYLRALRGGLFPGPPAAPEVRRRILADAGAEGAQAIYRRLAAIDPAAAARIDANDAVRIVRALEVYELTGRPLSEWHREHRFAGYADCGPCVGLALERGELYRRLDRRFDAMIAAGLIDEARGLIAAGMDRGGAFAATIGYREIGAWLRGGSERAEALALAKRETRRLAKRQMTWFRREPGIVWLDPAHGIEQALKLFTDYFNAGRARHDGTSGASGGTDGGRDRTAAGNGRA